MRKVTINDICREAGVSICTVSKVLNNKPKVGAKTRAKVLAVIKRLNFTPNAAARNLSQRRTDTIGVIFPRYGRGMFAQLLNGIEEVTQPRNLYILAISSTDAAGEVKPYEVALRVLREQRVDGIILCNPVLSDEQVRHLKKSEIPVVVTDRLSANPTLSGVFYDSYQGGYEATKHLIDHGFTRIANLTGPLKWESARERLRGYKTALRDYSLRVDPQLIVEGTWGIHPSTANFVEHFRDIEWPEAAVVANDDMALGLLRYTVTHRDKRIRSTAVVGFDDVEPAMFTGLTTLRGPIEEWGRRLATLLLEVIEEKPQRPRIVHLPVQLVIRTSCGCAGSLRVM